MGQEVTARVHHKGSVRKKLYVIEAEHGDKLEFNQDVMAGNEKIGRVLSSTDNVALALLIQEGVEKNDYTCNVNGMKIKVRS